MLGEVTIDGSWILTPAQLGQLIGAIGGITADVDVNVVKRNPGGRSTVLVPEGNDQKLTGAQAVTYATYTRSAHEDASAQLARLQQVVDGTLQALSSKSATTIGALLRRLGGGGGSTLGATRLAAFLTALAADNQSSSGLYATDLPETKIDAGGAPSYSVDSSSSGVPQLVSSHLADSVPAGANTARPSVEVLNGVGTPGLVQTACPQLAAHGFVYAGSGNASSFNIARSTVDVPASKLSLGYQVASALGLPRGDVERSSEDQSVASVVVTLGRDYQPTPTPTPIPKS
jgi:LytR cell envelope-related transcriptional attenuator